MDQGSHGHFDFLQMIEDTFLIYSDRTQDILGLVVTAGTNLVKEASGMDVLRAAKCVPKKALMSDIVMIGFTGTRDGPCHSYWTDS